jgi:hypothetical protein
MGSGRGAHEQENPRRPYATGLRTQPALVVRGSSRRITIMRLASANIRVINRRHSYLDRDPHRFPRTGIKPKPHSELTGRSISGATLRWAAPYLLISSLFSSRLMIASSCVFNPSGSPA